MKKFLPVLSAIALAVPMMAHAGTTSILFDADGLGGSYAPTAIDLLDFKPGNALSLGGGGLSTGQTVQLLYQANLGLTSLGGVSTSLTCSFNASCLTAVVGFQETATVTPGATTTNASFVLGGTAGPLPSATNFFYVYAKPTGLNQGNDLAGTGFATGNPADIILSGYVSQVISSNFTTDRTTQTFDQFGTDNYGGKQSIVGSGSTDLTVTITSSRPDYFPGLNVAGLAFSFFNTSTVTPFKQVDPSLQFSMTGLTNGGTFANLGPVNGFTTTPGSTDFQLQADGNQSFIAVPEPGTITLVGMALAGLGFVRRRRA